MSTVKRICHRSEEMYALIEGWAHSGQGKAEFCQASGIAVCVFDYWRRKRAMEQVKESAGRGGFTEVKAPDELRGREACQIRLHYPDGRILEFVSAPSVNLLREILTW
jgi:hypothetical protein